MSDDTQFVLWVAGLSFLYCAIFPSWRAAALITAAFTGLAMFGAWPDVPRVFRNLLVGVFVAGVPAFAGVALSTAIWTWIIRRQNGPAPMHVPEAPATAALSQKALQATRYIKDIVKWRADWEGADANERMAIRATLQRSIRELQQIHDALPIVGTPAN